MSQTQSEPQHTLYFAYTHGCGGLGDMIKGMATCLYIATNFGYNFDYRFNHEMGQIFKDKTFKPHEKYPVLRYIDHKQSRPIVDFFKNDKNRTQSYILYINGCLDFPRNPIDPSKPFLSEVTPFLNRYYKEILPIYNYIQAPNITQLSAPYQVLHVRMGDLYLNEATNKGDNRIKNQGNYEEKLEYCIQNLPHKPTLVCSDCQAIQQEILSKLPGSFVVQTNQYHFAYRTGRPTDQIVDSIKDTLVEHKIMTHADAIYKFVYSGYPILAATIGNVPLYEVTKNGFELYKSEWI